MFVVTLITTPQERALDGALVENLRNAWGGGDAQWLAIDEAAEFPVPALPDNQQEVWADLQAACVDLVAQPAANRRKKMLLADMDSTMIRQECIDELAGEAGVGARVADITARAMNGELDFEAALIERVGLLKDLPEVMIEQVLDQRITYMPGGYELVNTMKAHGAYAALVSGGFTAFTARVAAALGFDEHRANTLEEITVQRGILAADVLAVGDGANDLGMLGLAGSGVALHAKPTVQVQCDIRINHGDLTALLYLQGYNRDEFVT